MAQVDLEWRQERITVEEKAKFIFDKQLFTDCSITIINGDTSTKFGAHKVFLAMASPVFEVMFEQNFKEGSNLVEVRDVQPLTFRHFLSFVYTGRMENQGFDESSEVYKLAHKYMVNRLKKLCITDMCNHLTNENACIAIQIAMIYDEYELLTKSSLIISKNTKEVLSSPAFISIDLSTILLILDHNELSISEYELFKAVETWVESECDKRCRAGGIRENERSDIYKTLAKKFRFFSMSPEEFADGPCKIPMLSIEESVAILMNMISPGAPDIQDVPPWFIKERRRTFQESSGQFYFKWINDFTMVPKKIRYAHVIIKASSDVTICGLTVMGREIMQKAVATPSYIENFEITFSDSGTGRVLGELNFNDDLEYEELKNVYFSNPVKLLAEVEYWLAIKFNQSLVHAYKCVDLDETTLTHQDVKFTFRKDPPLNHLIPIYGIYYFH
ncbi:BTB/POZ domain-containing protein 2-like [Cimex lectularius]|uniref:BTB domain-containing protein n=1 Tax=Cimex lectularius TaxID=79782 RepID=A0A8I6R9B4_CIMLE|nr:BTB/POZ domain-containing protein 2-like [Cimex lectularius]